MDARRYVGAARYGTCGSMHDACANSAPDDDDSTTQATLRAPYPWFGGKSLAAALIWDRVGRVQNYVEPFAGSLAVLLGAPEIASIETVNDKDGFISNFWRAVAFAPDDVARYADWPVNENDLHARHAWLVPRRDDLTSKLEGDPEFYDAKIAGWWCWGICCWIGSGWCSGNGPWRVVDGKLQKTDGAGNGVRRQRGHLGNAGKGVHRQLVHLGNAGNGVHRQRVHLGDAGNGVRDWMRALSDRLRRVRVCCGDWTRVLGPSPTAKLGVTAVVLDPPYLATERDADLYSVDDDTIAHKVREWAIAHGDDTKMRIVLCGYEGEHAMPSSWECVEWKARGGYGSQGSNRAADNAFRERLWFSPHCLHPSTRRAVNLDLF